MHIKDFILLVLKVSLSNKITKQSTLLNFKKPEREREGGSICPCFVGWHRMLEHFYSCLNETFSYSVEWNLKGAMLTSINDLNLAIFFFTNYNLRDNTKLS